MYKRQHEYVSAARQLHAVLTETTHDGLQARDINEITKNLDIGQALADLRYAAGGVADLVRDVQHLPDTLLRSGLLFAPAKKLPPLVERLHERAAGKYVSVHTGEVHELAVAVRSAVAATDNACREIEFALGATSHLATAQISPTGTESLPEL